jgi:hypothetical protein
MVPWPDSKEDHNKLIFNNFLKRKFSKAPDLAPSWIKARQIYFLVQTQQPVVQPTCMASGRPSIAASAGTFQRRHPARKPLPDHLPREDVIHHPGDACPRCGGARLSKLGEDVTEVLERIPANLKVIRHIRPRLSCRSCETIIQASAPDLPIKWGRPGRALSESQVRTLARPP